MPDLPPLPFTVEPIPVPEVATRPLMPFEQQQVDALFEASCRAACQLGAAGMDDMCNLGRACK